MSDRQRSDDPNDDAFASSNEQASASDNRRLHYSDNFDDDELADSDKISRHAPVFPGANEEQAGIDDMGVAESAGPTGRGFNTAGKHPGPGTAADRGYGRTSDDAYGTGLDDTGMGDDMANSGSGGMDSMNRPLDQGNWSPSGYGTSGDQGSGLTGAGTSGENTAGSGNSSSIGPATEDSR